MSKIGINWNTLEYKTRKTISLIITKIYKRFSPTLMFQTILALSDINCTINEIEMISKGLQKEYNLLHLDANVDNDNNNNNNNDNNNNDIDNNNNNNNDNNNNDIDNNNNNNNNENENENKNEIKDDTSLENIATNIIKKKIVPLFIAFDKFEFFDTISNYISLGTYSNWELVQLLSCLSKLGTCHEMFYYYYYYYYCLIIIIVIIPIIIIIIIIIVIIPIIVIIIIIIIIMNISNLIITIIIIIIVIVIIVILINYFLTFSCQFKFSSFAFSNCFISRYNILLYYII